MTPEEFALLIQPKLVDGREVVVVAHHAIDLTSVIDGTNDDGQGSMWHMDAADPDHEVALLNLMAIMSLMGWEITDDWWESSQSNPDLYVADFVRIPYGQHRVVAS